MVKEIQLGETVRDVITGFSGVVTAKCTYITGCDQVHVQPRQSDKDGRWYDVTRLEVDNSTPVLELPKIEVVAKTGGPRETPGGNRV